jgi:sugar O-acyltransferase (sialic acid O-acetyltransferase NeuD family)
MCATTTDILIYGASGHARVIIDIIEKTGLYAISGLVDDTGAVTTLMGYQVATTINSYLDKGVRAGVVAIGDNWQRSRVVNKILGQYKDFEFVTTVHPSVVIGRDVVIGKGTVVMASCTINPCTKVGNHCIVNTGSRLDHDCEINDFASVAPGVTLGGNVRIGEYTAVGLGAAVIQKVEIGSHSVIGAGSSVIRNIPSNCISYGNPCKFIRDRSLDEPYL